MKQQLFVTLLITFSLNLAFSQTPNLINDFNPGDNPAFSEFNYQGITYNDAIILPGGTIDSGEEVLIVKNGELSFLKEIREGLSGSFPNNFIEFKGKVFFSAFSTDEGGSLWMTDGTEDGTELFFAPNSTGNSKPDGLIVSSAGFLYFTHQGNLYKTDGLTVDLIFNGVDFKTTNEQESNNYTRYGSEIAFVAQMDNTISLYQTNNNSVELLGNIENIATNDLIGIYGLTEVEAGLLFALDFPTSAGSDENYVFNKITNEIAPYSLNNSYAGRIHGFNNMAFTWVRGEGYYTTNGFSGEENLLYESGSLSFTPGRTIQHGTYRDKIVFQADADSIFDKDFMMYSDGTTENTDTLFESSWSVSNVLMDEALAFVAIDNTNGLNPSLYYIYLEDGSFENFYTFPEEASTANAILPVGVLNNKLYFISNLDPTVGRELYSIEVNLPVSTKESFKNQPIFNIKIAGNTFTVLTENTKRVTVDIITVDGRVVKTIEGETNTTYELYQKGIFYLRSVVDGKVVTKNIFIR